MGSSGFKCFDHHVGSVGSGPVLLCVALPWMANPPVVSLFSMMHAMAMTAPVGVALVAGWLWLLFYALHS